MKSAEVYLWGTPVGTVRQENLASVPIFIYDDDFIKRGICPAPIVMPLSNQAYSFPELAQESFHGLPGLLADSLPDKFGTKLIERFLTDRGSNIGSLSAVERLLYTGTRGMGALEYYPAANYAEVKDETLDVSALVDVASDVLKRGQDPQKKIDEHAMEQFMSIGTSAGGARAKAVVALNPKTNDIRAGQHEAKKDYEHWLIKFDGVSNNKDKGDKADPKCYTRIEYAYYLMAKKAGIDMMECRLYQEAGRYHFMTKRFDRTDDGEKLHIQTLGAIAHFDYNKPATHSYEQAYDIMCKLGLSQDDAKRLFRRMVFNIYAKNHDDHVKNITFLMDKSGHWQFSSAYDLTYACDPTNMWLAEHQMTVSGKTEGFLTEDLLVCGKHMNISKDEALAIIDDVKSALGQWEICAEEALRGEKEMEYIKGRLILE